MIKIYLSGQISGLPEKEYEANFASAAELVRNHREVAAIEEDIEIVNPVTLGKEWERKTKNCGLSPLTYTQILMNCLYELSKCDAIYMLKGWNHSSGARAELAFADAIRLKVFHWSELKYEHKQNKEDE